MKHNKIFAFLLAGVLSLGIVGCGSAGSSDSSTEQAASSASGDLKPLRLGCPGFDDYPLLENGKLAYDKGYLEEELNAAGYTLDLVTFQEAGPAINEAYASGGHGILRGLSGGDSLQQRRGYSCYRRGR